MINETPLRSSVSLIDADSGALGTAAYGVGGMPLGEMLAKRVTLGKSDKEREETLKESDKNVGERGYGKNMWEGAKTMGKGIGAIGAGLGAVGGGLTGYASASASGKDPLLSALMGAGLGGVGGGLYGGAVGAGYGALGGAASKAVDKHTSEDSQDRARKMVSKHPYLTSLPGGNMIGAAFA